MMRTIKDLFVKAFKAIKKSWLEGMYIQGQNLMMMNNAYQGKPTWSIG